MLGVEIDTMRKPPAGTPAAPIVSEFASDPEMAGVIAQFVNELPARARTLLDCWRAQNFTEAERTAHQLKGAGAGYGFPSISLAASRVETDLRGKSAAQVAAEAERIAADVRSLADLCARAVSRRP